MLMDEPFSAVDPVVRGQLQEEFLRLQQDLGKTIVLVTHDIDEAVKLGDHIAVLRTGGHLAQLATPTELLTRPADDFVAGFVGRDRGYRALGFETAGDLSPQPEPTVRVGSDSAAAAGVARDNWILVVTADDEPVGWWEIVPGATGQIDPARLNRGGTRAGVDGTFRDALDAALSSPSGRGVVIDGDRRLVGTVTAGEVVRRIEAQLGDRRAAERTAVAG